LAQGHTLGVDTNPCHKEAYMCPFDGQGQTHVTKAYDADPRSTLRNASKQLLMHNIDPPLLLTRSTCVVKVDDISTGISWAIEILLHIDTATSIKCTNMC